MELQEAAAAHPGRPQGDDRTGTTIHDDIFSEEFLLTRPLLTRSGATSRPCCSIDEVDKVDVEVEGLLLEVLSDFQVSIPELGTIAAVRRPLVVLTSNATRELSEALKRRCLFLHLDYPDAEREREIVLVAGARARRRSWPTSSSRTVARAARARAEEGAVDLRDARLGAHPARARARTPSTRRRRPTLGVVLKHASDQARAARRAAAELMS